MRAILDEAMVAANEAFAEKLAWCDRHSVDVRREDGLALRAALEAAAPHLERDAYADLTTGSPRLPSGMRDQLFEILLDFMDKFELVSRQQGPSRHAAAPGYEWGDMCGYFEIRVVAAIRAKAIASRG
jgi:hypothetical protein